MRDSVSLVYGIEKNVTYICFLAYLGKSYIIYEEKKCSSFDSYYKSSIFLDFPGLADISPSVFSSLRTDQGHLFWQNTALLIHSFSKVLEDFKYILIIV